MTGKSDYDQHLQNALSNYGGVLNDEWVQKFEEADEGLEFPESPEDLMAYLGNMDLLPMNAKEEAFARKGLMELLKERGPRYVWGCKLRLKLELRYIFQTFKI